MKKTALILLLAAGAMAASAQTPAKPATATAKSAVTAKSAATAAKSAKSASAADKLPPGVPVVTGPKATLYTVVLRYQEVKVGDGAEAQSGKLLKYFSTIYLASDGTRIDSPQDHRQPVLDKDHKPVMDADGKPKLADPLPATTIMGLGRPLPGWDLGFEGMKVGGKRRVFIPWQLGLGMHEIPARDATHPAIPAKSDLILDLELTEVADAPQMPAHPTMMPGMKPPMGAHPMSGAPATPATPATPIAPAAAPTPAAPATSAAPVAPATPVTPGPPETPAPPPTK